MENPDVVGFVLKPEVIIAIGTAVTTVLGYALRFVNTQLSQLTVELTELRLDNEEKNKDLKRANESNDNIRSNLVEIQRLYGETLSQGMEANRTTAKLQNDLNDMHKVMNELQASIIEKDNKISKLVQEVARLQPFEKLVSERNGEVAKLTKDMAELQHKVAILEAEKRGAKEALQALNVNVNEETPNEAVKQPAPPTQEV